MLLDIEIPGLVGCGKTGFGTHLDEETAIHFQKVSLSILLTSYNRVGFYFVPCSLSCNVLPVQMIKILLLF